MCYARKVHMAGWMLRSVRCRCFACSLLRLRWQLLPFLRGWSPTPAPPPQLRWTLLPFPSRRLPSPAGCSASAEALATAPVATGPSLSLGLRTTCGSVCVRWDCACVGRAAGSIRSEVWTREQSVYGHVACWMYGAMCQMKICTTFFFCHKNLGYHLVLAHKVLFIWISMPSICY
jgi:hypothetical protein